MGVVREGDHDQDADERLQREIEKDARAKHEFKSFLGRLARLLIWSIRRAQSGPVRSSKCRAN
jgi:hypothetical protein